MHIAKIIHGSDVDGPGCRSVIFVQGCSIRCQGCQNPALQSPNGNGYDIAPKELAEQVIQEAVKSQGHWRPNITISGGEPFDQADELCYLLAWLKAHGAGHIVVYTGYTFEALQERGEHLGNIDVLVDGPYRPELDLPHIKYRGSSNQRVIDVPATLEKGEVVTLAWWDRSAVIIKPDGSVIAPRPIAERLSQLGLGVVKATRGCGELGIKN